MDGARGGFKAANRRRKISGDDLGLQISGGRSPVAICGGKWAAEDLRGRGEAANPRLHPGGGRFITLALPKIFREQNPKLFPQSPMKFPLLFPVVVGAAFSVLATSLLRAQDDPRPVVDASKVTMDQPANPALPTLFVVGDSTARSNMPLRGWGSEIGAFFDPAKLNVLNRAIGGRSSRTFQTEGRWDKVLAEMKPGDLVLIQFGHNDAGNYQDPKAKGRPSLRGEGEETAQAVKSDGKTMETIHGFGWYMRKYATDAKAKGATPILLSMVPHKIWKDGKISRPEQTGFVKWTEDAAKSTGALYLDTNEIIAEDLEKLGPAAVEPLFGDARTHSTPAGAKFNAEAIVSGLKTLDPDPLAKFFSAEGEKVQPAQVHRP